MPQAREGPYHFQMSFLLLSGCLLLLRHNTFLQSVSWSPLGDDKDAKRRPLSALPRGSSWRSSWQCAVSTWDAPSTDWWWVCSVLCHVSDGQVIKLHHGVLVSFKLHRHFTLFSSCVVKQSVATWFTFVSFAAFMGFFQADWALVVVISCAVADGVLLFSLFPANTLLLPYYVSPCVWRFFLVQRQIHSWWTSEVRLNYSSISQSWFN